MRGYARVAGSVVLVGLLVVVTLSAAGTGSKAASAHVRWVITDLGALGVDHPKSSAVAINAHGQIVGSSSYGNGSHTHAFLWQAGKMRDLGAGTVAVAINDSGQVAVNGVPHAFLWENGKRTDLGVLGAGNYTEASAMNDRGQIVGSSGTESGSNPFLWQNGKMSDLGTLGRAGGVAIWPKASAINERGQVVGTSQTRSRNPVAYLWQNGRMRNLGGWRSAAIAINDRGVIVGRSGEHAFKWENGKMTDLGTLGGTRSAATAINNRGQIVGWSEVASGAEHAFLWQKGKMIDLGTLGAVSSDAVAINERGQIIVNRRSQSCQHWAEESFPETSWSDICFGTASVWENGTLTDLGTLPGGKNSSGTALNERGQIIGWSTTKTGERHPVLWTLRSGA